MSHKLIFLSDIHLETGHESKARALIAFLEELPSKNVTDLFLVGDIFDLWIARHKYFEERYSDVVAAIRKVCDQGIKVHYFEGNHDLYLKTYWTQFKNLKVYPGPENFEYSGKKIRVEHGDQINPNDKGYLFLRWFLRTFIMKLIARFLPGGIVSWIGNKASHSSRKYTSTAKKIEEDDTINMLRDYAKNRFDQEAFDLLVTGHVHVQDDWQIMADGFEGRSVNLGTWLKKPIAFEWVPNGGSRWLDIPER